MPVAALDYAAHVFARLPFRFLRLQKTKMFRPGDIDQEFQPVFFGQVQEPGWRRVINAQKVGAEFAHLFKVPRHLLARRKCFTLFIWR